jgi:hypothetical protein
MWNVHQGTVVMVNDLLIVNLGKPTREVPLPRFHMSFYDVSSSPVGSGHVAFVRDSAAPEAWLVKGTTFTDSPPLADFLQRRVGSARWTGVDLSVAPRQAKFVRSELSEELTVSIASRGLDLRVRWEGLGTPRWSDGVSPNYPREHSWAIFIESSRTEVIVNRRKIKETPYPDDRFRVMVGRPLSSCLIGLAEVHLKPSASARRT